MEHNKDFFQRNRGLLTVKQQEKLASSTVAIIGVGGDGGLLAERLVRMGVGNLILADPENFEDANINRQYGSNSNTIGKNKAIAVAEELRLINNKALIKVYTEGISTENVSEIIDLADVIVDEIEYSLPVLSVMVHREARRQNKNVFMGANIGWGASVFCFEPSGVTFEDHFCYNPTKQTIDPTKYSEYIPDYFSSSLIENITAGYIPVPSVSPAVSLVAAILASEIVFYITGIRKPVTMPEFIAIDLFNYSCNILKNPSYATLPN